MTPEETEELSHNRATFKVAKVVLALVPLAKIADAYDKSGLDEHRPGWGDKDPKEVVLVSGRGGKELLTLEHAFEARRAIKELSIAY